MVFLGMWWKWSDPISNRNLVSMKSKALWWHPTRMACTQHKSLGCSGIAHEISMNFITMLHVYTPISSPAIFLFSHHSHIIWKTQIHSLPRHDLILTSRLFHLKDTYSSLPCHELSAYRSWIILDHEHSYLLWAQRWKAWFHAAVTYHSCIIWKTQIYPLSSHAIPTP